MDYLCNNCNAEFTEPKLEERVDGATCVCPYCGSEEWDEIDELDEPNHPCS